MECMMVPILRSNLRPGNGIFESSLGHLPAEGSYFESEVWGEGQGHVSLSLE